MEFRNIKTFLKIVELQSFSKAADAIGYTQSTVTAQIHNLEKELEVTLFDRFNKSIRLTPQGEQFLMYARKLIHTEALAKASVHTTDELAGSLHIAMAPSICSCFFPDILARYHEKYPKVQLRVDTYSTKQLFDQLAHNYVDLIYTFDHRVYQQNQIILLEHEEPVYFVARPDHPFCGQTVSLNEIATQPLLLTEQGQSYRNHLEQLFAEYSLQLTPILEIDQAEMLMDLVLKGSGISFLPAYTIRKKVMSGELCVLDVKECNITEWRQVIQHKNKWRTPQMNAMVEILKEMCTDTPPLIP